MFGTFSSNELEWKTYALFVLAYSIVVCLPLAVTFFLNGQKQLFKKQLKLSFVIFIILALGDSIPKIKMNFIVFILIFVSYVICILSLVRKNENL